MNSLYIIEVLDNRPELKDKWQPIHSKLNGYGFFYSKEEADFNALKSVTEGAIYRISEFKREEN